ncbi:hypothetical protein SISSUDRAFT_276660 [Sistotremastrum suecicum HHB10207 ss-3]|uniref:Uncharacterized protein n=1 Tax=Sistotremastrum suecicum HHB10207 ss-3 TaxID=1314776 RepID=A0A165ZM25_9AGAM|nr:hypothetical protein SISSUDRAFT_276660 [Sistotremastrum suecicum HHB10207 ss-3]
MREIRVASQIRMTVWMSGDDGRRRRRACGANLTTVAGSGLVETGVEAEAGFCILLMLDFVESHPKRSSRNSQQYRKYRRRRESSSRCRTMPAAECRALSIFGKRK